MMLPGRLGPMTLGDVLGALHREGATGVLELTESHGIQAGRVHRVHVEAGLVGLIESTLAAPRLGDILLRFRLIDDLTHRRLGDRVATGERKLVGEMLIEMGLVGTHELAAALRLQRRDRLERLFRLEDARLAFRIARAPGKKAIPPLAPSQFLHGRARARAQGKESANVSMRRDPVRTRALSTLGLPEGADLQTVRATFRQLAARMHPDRFPAAGSAERADILRRFAEITAAYHMLVA